MIILHSSDLHGQYHRLLDEHADSEFDVWLDTGDFFDNAGWVNGHIEAIEEVRFQVRWLGHKSLPTRLAEWLRGRPALLMPGNHGFIELAPYLRAAGANATRVTPGGVSLLGLRWAGFREIPPIAGEWVGEEEDPSKVIAAAFTADPDILVTHGPPGGILDEKQGYGCPNLATALAYRPHKIQAHFFGHTHQNGGEQVERMGIQFYNGACHATLHTLNLTPQNPNG